MSENNKHRSGSKLTESEATNLAFDSDWRVAIKIMAERMGVYPAYLHDDVCGVRLLHD